MLFSVESGPPPASYRIVRLLLDFRLTVGLLVVVAAFWALSVAPGSPVRDGLILGLGWDPEQFGARQAGQVLGNFLVPIILLAVMRWTVSRGKVLGYRCLQVFDLLITLPLGPIGSLMGLIGFALSFRSAYVEHCGHLRSDNPSLKAA